MDIREFYPNFAFMNTGQKLALLDRNKKEKNIMENVISFTISKLEVYTLDEVTKIVKPLIDNNIDFYTVTGKNLVELHIPTTPNVSDSFNSIVISRLYLLGVRETFYCSQYLVNWELDEVNYFKQRSIDVTHANESTKVLRLTFDELRADQALDIIELLAGSNYIPSFQSWESTEN